MYDKIDKTEYTPMMRQYLTIKEDYRDSLVFFRLGDFYEMFFNDALVASKELEIVLTSRDAGSKDRVPMCGVPFHSVDSYIERLSSKGYKVAIVEQLETPNAKNIVKRDVVRVITPGTNLDAHFLNEKDNNYLASIAKVDEHYSFSYLDLSTGDAKTTLLPNKIEEVYDELNKLAIKEAIVGPDFPKAYYHYLTKILGIMVTIVEDEELDEYLNNLLVNLEEGAHKTAKRLLCYLVKTQKRVLVHLKPFLFYDNNKYLKLDPNTIKNLELISSLKGERNKNNLFACLDKCSTAMGSRHLKQSILYPLTSLDPIKERHQIIDDLMKHFLIVEELKTYLKEIYDLERIVGRISYGTLSPKDLLQLKYSLKVIPAIKTLLTKINTASMLKLNRSIKEFTALYELLAKAIDDNAPFLLRDGGVIKKGYSLELDKIKDIGANTKEFLAQLELREKERTGIKSLKIGFNKVFGYYIEVTKANLPLVKDEFGYIRKQTTSNAERYITEELKAQETLILRSNEHSLALEQELFENIRNVCKSHSYDLQDLAKVISEIDMLIALMSVAKNYQYTKPKISLYHEIKITQGRHPVVEMVSSLPFIPNDLTMYNDDQILLITGPNMSGKSTYMRQNALIVIMAQMGSFVPAVEAEIPIFDQIFTRIGSSDDIASGTSTFMTEMLEVNYALQAATQRSLIIFDEVGRGTATYDGLALAQSIIEYIHEKLGTKMLFSTHYHELTSLDKSLAGLKNVHVEAREDRGKIIFFHQVKEGSTDKSYGIHVAALAKLPISLIHRANDILQKIEANKNYDEEKLALSNYQEPVFIEQITKDEENILQELKEVSIDDLRPIDALLFLSKLKEKMTKDE